MYELQREIERLRQETIYLKVNEKPPKIILHQPPPIQVSAPAPPAPIVQPVSFIYNVCFSCRYVNSEDHQKEDIYIGSICHSYVFDVLSLPS